MTKIKSFFDRYVTVRYSSLSLIVFVYSLMILNELCSRLAMARLGNEDWPYILRLSSRENLLGIWVLLFVAAIWTNRLPGKIIAFLIGCFSTYLVLEAQSFRLICAYGMDITYYNNHKDVIHWLQNIAVIYFILYFTFEGIRFCFNYLSKKKIALLTSTC